MSRGIAPFDRCPALDGYHCQTNSLAKMFHFYQHPLSEEMLLGLGAGLGFIYWHTKGGRQAGPKSEFGDITFIGGKDQELRMNLFNLYIFIEIGGTGGGCFRYMYARFLEEAAKISGNNKLAETAAKIEASGKLFSEIGRSFENAERDADIETKVGIAGDRFAEIADIEDEAFHELESAVD